MSGDDFTIKRQHSDAMRTRTYRVWCERCGEVMSPSPSRTIADLSLITHALSHGRDPNEVQREVRKANDAEDRNR